MSEFHLIHKNTRGRIEIIDALRGLSILLMVIYHLGYDLVSYKLIPYKLLHNPVLDTAQVFFALLFIVISGVSCSFSKSNFKRGIVIAAAAGLVTLGTYIFDPTCFVKFGILHFLCAAVLLYALLKKPLSKLPLYVSLPLWAVLFGVSYPLLSMRFDVDFLWALGLMPYGFVSADYFPLFPYIFAFFFGTALGPVIKAGKFPKWFYRFSCKPLSFAGRNTLLIYLVHQPVCMGVVWAILKVAEL